MILVDLCQILTDRPVKSTSLCKVLLRINGHDSRQVASDVWNLPGLRNGEHDSRFDVWDLPWSVDMILVLTCEIHRPISLVHLSDPTPRI